MGTQVQLPGMIQDKIIDIGTLVMINGEVDSKTKSLVAVATALTSFCSHCHGQFRATARKLGASDAEIAEVEKIALRMRVKCQNESAVFKLNQ